MSVLVPRAPLPATARLATIDARGAAAIAVREHLLCADFLRWGGETAADTPFRLAEVREEWPEPDRAMVYPSATLVDREDVPAGDSSFVPQPLEETWHEFGEGTVLWKLAEATFSFQADFWSDDVPTREAIAARLPALFAPGEDGTRVVLAGSERYFRRPVRATLLSWRRMDEPGSVYVRERRLMAVIRCEVDVVDLRCATALNPSVRVAEIGETVDPGVSPEEFGRVDAPR